MLHHRTNLVSRTYLEQAGRGLVSSVVSALLLALSRGTDEAALEEAILPLLRTGHTSGRDTAAGLLIGLSVWQIDYEALAVLLAPAFTVPYSE